jgi:hypothetical protein
MEVLLAIVLGFCLGIIAVSPYVPGLRPLLRKVIAGLFAVASLAAVAGAAAFARWREVIAEARTEREAEAEARTAAEAETITISLPEKY